MRPALFLVSLVLVACNQSSLSKKLSDSDSVAISFNVRGSDAVSKTVATTEKAAIRKLTGGFMDGKTDEILKCGYDGNMIFYSGGMELLPVVFNHKDKDCRYFLFELDGKVMNVRMSNEAADLLESLETGNISY